MQSVQRRLAASALRARSGSPHVPSAITGSAGMLLLLIKEHCDTLFDTRVVSFPVSMFNGNALSSTAMVSAFTLCNSRYCGLCWGACLLLSIHECKCTQLCHVLVMLKDM